ncbi:hypothetical protein HNR39_002486 [Glaciimonas immobilis]|uniref:Uncharacterized protein n=1 Tax=Glaciimonas immobilis TaxID=728004 RepID=A0A840RVF3_9BURK|nr:hypothetical protein [Glaciimonas immobilis]
MIQFNALAVNCRAQSFDPTFVKNIKHSAKKIFRPLNWQPYRTAPLPPQQFATIASGYPAPRPKTIPKKPRVIPVTIISLDIRQGATGNPLLRQMGSPNKVAGRQHAEWSAGVRSSRTLLNLPTSRTRPALPPHHYVTSGTLLRPVS